MRIARASVAAASAALLLVPASPAVDAALVPAPGMASPAVPATSGEHVPGFSRERAMRHVRWLSREIGVRVRATPGERRAARYVSRRLERLGYRVRVQEFDVDGGTSRNVVAWWPGTRRQPIVLGAHIDTVADSPGANDNASGVAVLLEVARVMAGRDPVRWIRFVGFGSEEYGADGRHHVGSQTNVGRMTPAGRRRLAGMVSVDMLADGRPLIVGTAGIGPGVLARTLHDLLDEAGIGVRYQVTCDCSDHGPFERAGIPGAFLWSGGEPDYHSPSDLPANLAPGDLLRTGRAVRRFVLEIDWAMIRSLRAA